MSGYDLPEENTLGVVIGKRGRPKRSKTSPAAKALRQASAGGPSLGAGYLGIGGGILAGSTAVFGLAVFLMNFSRYPDPLPAAFAWLLYCLVLAAVGVTITILGERMPNWLFAAFLAGLAFVVALDFFAIMPIGNVGAHASASVAASFGLLMAAALRRAVEILAAAALLVAAFIIAIALTTPLTRDTLPDQIVVMAAVALPPVFAVWLVFQFRRMVQLELDRSLIQSTVSAPRFAVGMLASEELARLDLAAERLFDSVAGGHTELPLDPKTASVAASLATELRLHLIEGRRETWLYHAITESEHLGKSVTLSDASSLAGILDREQRDGLLSAVWLLVGTKSVERPTVRLSLGPVRAPDEGEESGSVTVPIVITTTNISRNRVDPAVWASLARVGSFTNTFEGSNLSVEIDCMAANPADNYHAEQSTHNK